MRTHEQFVDFVSDPTKRSLDALVAGARIMQAGVEFDDDVSLLQIDFD